jgi:hypothetical protein
MLSAWNLGGGYIECVLAIPARFSSAGGLSTKSATWIRLCHPGVAPSAEILE